MILPILSLLITAPAQGPADASAPAWGSLQAQYSYKHLDLSSAQETVTQEPTDTRVTFTFPGVPGDVVHGILVEPKDAKNSPCVVLLHGLGGSKTDMEKVFGAALLAKGIAYAAIDAPGHGERATPDDKKEIGAIDAAFLVSKGDLLKAALSQDKDGKILPFLGRNVKDGVMDERRLLDYVTSRKEIDYHHIGLIGVSMGSIMSSILGPLDSRVSEMTLLVGGDPVLPLIPSVSPRDRELGFDTSCSLFAGHYQNRPVRMLNGTKDTIMPRAATDRLYAAYPAAEKSISWFDSDHFLPPAAVRESVEYSADHLGKGGF